MTTILCLLLACQQPGILYVDDSPPSRLIVAELTRDWLAPASRIELDSPQMAMLSEHVERQSRVMKRLTIVRLERRSLVDLPAIAFAAYGDPVSIDRRAFAASGVPLLTVETLLLNSDMDLSRWRETCQRRMRLARREHMLVTTGWLHKNHRDIWERLVLKGMSFNDATLVAWTDYLDGEYHQIDGYTRFSVPVMPNSPLRLMPWEVAR